MLRSNRRPSAGGLRFSGGVEMTGKPRKLALFRVSGQGATRRLKGHVHLPSAGPTALSKAKRQCYS
ncbi:hypothetical protein MES4922_200002 [Mesorhizobium ventifaucium]|uniref:Propionyl-coenzyme A carboxylase alpha polypeptide n=1 Tax=Mesorhizobium ventifaucium TaxID=666020 RepID=A0ABM9DQF9_9HYPH|nr:hypothetical protein MES4922_200002 [Mesorhizobium ventifaucium]